jgi:very-short-patch-repair endonuclease
MSWVERLRRQNKIRSKFKRDRVTSCTVPQKKLYYALKQIGLVKHFKPSLEREIYTKMGVRFSDIYIKKYGLNIEVDGDYHSSQDQKISDTQKEKEIWDKKKIITVRFTNTEIMNNFEKVLIRLNSLIDELEILPNWKCPGKGKKRLNSTLLRKKIYQKFGNVN